ncbi:MAG: hypothetical protein KBA75_06190 [Alphaproteobacteria bacterium]|nr:hypothetical protein [Alphaproteobacteria bacterium]
MQQVLLLPQPGRAAKAFAGIVYWLRHRLYALCGLQTSVQVAAQAERGRWVLWLPVLIGFGFGAISFCRWGPVWACWV